MAANSWTSTVLRRAGAAAIALAATAAPAYAQLDPLLFMKTVQPNVIVAVDTSNRMQRDAPTDNTNPQATSNYYDPNVYSRTGAAWEATLGVTPLNTVSTYRRKYAGLNYTSNGSGDRFTANTIAVTTDTASRYAYFGAPTRLSIARAALYQAIAENQTVARFGLVAMRQASASIAQAGPVADADPGQQTPTDANSLAGRWNLYRGAVGANNGAQTNASGFNIAADSSNATSNLLSLLAKDVRSGGLLPAGNDDANSVDTPVNNMLVDAKAAATALLKNDASCRNTVVVLIVGGGEGNTAGATNSTLASTAAGFLSVYNGHRVPVYVIAIAPNNNNGDVAALQSIATQSGGRYFEITSDMINRALGSTMQQMAGGVPTGTIAVPEMVRALNIAVQHAFAKVTDFDTAPTAALPAGPYSEYQVTSPIIGSVNLNGASDISGHALTPDAATVKDRAGNVIPQRSNLMITTGLAVPGFDLVLRGFRMYKPVADSTQPSGWKFQSDGTRLWVASTPDPASRNLYTALPDGTMVAFNTANAATLARYMNLTAADAAYVIDLVRSQPLGAVLDSTPAIMNAPSLDPPPDDTYPAFAVANKDRRSIIFVGTNRGILEGIDARLGIEVWGFVPFNLLPKLRTLADGQPVGNFDFFVDGSPKIADVKLSDHTWHTALVVGEGPGGTFYQTFDATLANMASSVSPADDNIADVLAYFSSPNVIPVEWAFPAYSHFDPTLTQYQWYGASKPYGDLSASATPVEKTVGQTWSDPAVGQVVSNTSPYVVLVGSGFAPYSLQQQSNRGGIVAGTTFYMLTIEGALLGSKDVGSDGTGETINNCFSTATNDCTYMKNALQSDPVATGPSDSRFITKAYIGDLDGRIWRFDITLSGTSPAFTGSATKLYSDAGSEPIFASMATVNVGGTQQYIFTGTGSDLLPGNNVSQQYRLVGVLDNGTTGTKTFEIDMLKVASNSSTAEKVTSFPAVAGDIVFFTTTTFPVGTACSLPSANLYALTFIGGPAYDTNNDGKFDTKDSTLVKTIAGARATAPFIVDQHLVFSTGGTVAVFGDPTDYNNGVGQAGVRILSWRDAR